MAAAVMMTPIQQFFGNDGLPLALGYLYCYEAGSVSTPQDVWTDPDLSIAYTNPVELNAYGRPSGPIYLSPTPAYKFVLKDANLVTIWVADNVSTAQIET
jgi:hypothetical protein